MDYIKQAKALKNKGISVVPLRTDGSKLPSLKWSAYNDRIMSDFEIETNFKDCGGVAAVTGEISQLYVYDFDLKYQLDSQDYWKAFMDRVPKELKKKFLINKTKNGGFHVWFRTAYVDKSRKLTRRANTIPELMDRYETLTSQGVDPVKASGMLLKSPFEVIIETRSRGSYAVFYHPEYTRFYGTKLQTLTIEETEFLNEIAYSLDFAFMQEKIYVGKVNHFSTVKKYNEDATTSSVLDLLTSCGMFSYVDTERDGNIRILRVGSKSEYSGRIYVRNSVLHLFSENTIFSSLNKMSFSPFEVYMVCNNFNHEQAVNALTEK